MHVFRSGHSFRRQMTAVGVLASAFLGLHVSDSAAQTPPQPDFAWPYGVVQAAGANLDPAEQPVLALLNGRVCGHATTEVAAAQDGTPASDVGKTVYVVDVLANGTESGHLPGCGTPGAPITLYFPVAGRVALQQPLFAQGGQRADLELGQPLVFRLQAPLLASDSTP